MSWFESKPWIFARVGWMRKYRGEGNPEHGGKFNDSMTGYEYLNFDPWEDGKVYGFVQPTGGKRRNQPSDDHRNQKINLKSVCGHPVKDKMAEGVLVIFFATPPDDLSLSAQAGQRVVGWYTNATVYQHVQNAQNQRHSKSKSPHERQYNIVENKFNAYLLQEQERRHDHWKIKSNTKSKKISPGQKNIFYRYTENGDRTTISNNKNIDQIKLIIDRIESMSQFGKNTEIESTELSLNFARDQDMKVKVEKFAVAKAISHYQQKGWIVQDAGDTESYDLILQRNGIRRTVEVKGTRGHGESLIFTGKEARYAIAKSNVATHELFIARDIVIEGDEPVSCRVFVCDPWCPLEKYLEPSEYRYRMIHHKPREIIQNNVTTTPGGAGG